MLLVLSINFYFHYNIWGCMCSTGPFRFRWLQEYVYSACYYHHQIGSIHLSHCYIFPWLCALAVCYITLSIIVYTFRTNQEFVFIIIAQLMMRAISRVRFGLQIAFVYTLHHIIIIIIQNYLKTLSIWNACQILSSVWVRLSIFSQLSIIQHVGLCVFS